MSAESTTILKAEPTARAEMYKRSMGNNTKMQPQTSHRVEIWVAFLNAAVYNGSIRTFAKQRKYQRRGTAQKKRTIFYQATQQFVHHVSHGMNHHTHPIHDDSFRGTRAVERDSKRRMVCQYRKSKYQCWSGPFNPVPYKVDAGAILFTIMFCCKKSPITFPYTYSILPSQYLPSEQPILISRRAVSSSVHVLNAALYQSVNQSSLSYREERISEKMLHEIVVG